MHAARAGRIATAFFCVKITPVTFLFRLFLNKNKLGFEDYSVASQPSHQLQAEPKAAAKRENGLPRLASADAAEQELLALQAAAAKAAAAEEPAVPGETSFVDKVCRPQIPFSRTLRRSLACEFLVVDALCLVEACTGRKLESGFHLSDKVS
jgi:hypothetical protein